MADRSGSHDAGDASQHGDEGGTNSSALSGFPTDYDDDLTFSEQLGSQHVDWDSVATLPPAAPITEGVSNVQVTAPLTQTQSLQVDTTFDVTDDEPTPRAAPISPDDPTAQADPMDVDPQTPRSGGLPFPPPLLRDAEVEGATASFTTTLSQPIGFYNPGNQCYLNAVLAALASSRIMVGYLETWYSCNEKELDAMKKHLLLRRIHNSAGAWYREASQRTVNQVRHHLIVNCCADSDGRLPTARKANGRIDGWQPWSIQTDDKLLKSQQDASEFLIWLLGSISDQLAGNGEPSFGDEEYNMTAAQKRFSALFQFSLTFRKTYRECSPLVRWRMAESGSDSHREYTLQLTTPNRSARKTTLEKLIDRYFNKHSVNRTTEKRARLQSAPTVLFIHTNRTTTNADASEFLKKLSRVSIPEHLDLSEYLECHEFGKGSAAKYRLRAIVSHAHVPVREGELPSALGGHYVALIRAGEKDNTWYLVDDERVQKRNLNEFNDSRGRAKVGGDCEYVATPMIMLYELTEFVTKPGREPFYEQHPKLDLTQKGSSEQRDDEKSEQRGQGKARPRVDDFVPWKDIDVAKSTTNGLEGNTPPSAQLFVRLAINGTTFNYPVQQLPGFTLHAERLFTMDVAIKAKNPVNAQEDLYLDALKALQSETRTGHWLPSAAPDQSRDRTSFRQRIKPGRAKRA